MLFQLDFPIIIYVEEGTGECSYEKSKNQNGAHGAEYVPGGACRQGRRNTADHGLIEAGRYNPTIKLCIKICIALHKHLDDLFWEDDYDKEEL